MLNFLDEPNDRDRQPRPATLDATSLRLIEHLPLPAFALGADGRVIAWNTACERLTDVSAAEVIGTCEHWRAFHAIQQPLLAEVVLQAAASGGPADQAGPGGRALGPSSRDGDLRHDEGWCAMPRLERERYLAFDAGPIRDPSGRLIAVIQTLCDMTRTKRAEATGQTLATHDRPTGLPSRRSFDQMAQIVWLRAGKQGWPLSVMMIEVDCFELYGDAYGSERADACLEVVGATIGRHLPRAADFAARVGGAKFGLLLPDTSMGVAGALAESLRQAVADCQLPHRTSVAAPFVSVSIGVAAGTALDTKLEQLFADADAALTRAKREGRNRCSASRAGVALSVIDAFDDRPTTREALRRRRDLKAGT